MGHCDRAFVTAAVVLVLGGVTLGFYELGGRPRQRDLRTDEVRLGDLKSIAGEIHVEWENAQTKNLNWKPPAALKDVTVSSRNTSIADPITGIPYDYVPQSGSDYELCAVFAADSAAQDLPLTDKGWSYPKGRHCFALDASKSPF
jgi:hypothetical protein